MRYHIHGFADKVPILVIVLNALPRIGDAIYTDDEQLYKITEVVWRLDLPVVDERVRIDMVLQRISK